MKRVLSFLTMATLVACTCLSQIPDQLVYVDQNCEAVMPDYTPEVVVTDNCDNASVVQVPAAGTLLTSATPVTSVTITAQDISGNTASIAFDVVLVDTIAPTIEAGPGLLAEYTYKEIGYMWWTVYRHIQLKGIERNRLVAQWDTIPERKIGDMTIMSVNIPIPDSVNQDVYWNRITHPYR